MNYNCKIKDTIVEKSNSYKRKKMQDMQEESMKKSYKNATC